MVDLPRSFKAYLQDTAREYHVRVKTIVPLDDDQMQQIERVMAKYVVTDISKPVKTIMQKNPLDFQDIRNAEVYIVDVKTELPVSAYVLQQELKLAMLIPEKYIVVRSVNDPLEIENQRIAAKSEINMKSVDDGLEPTSRLSTNPEYDEDEKLDSEDAAYGDEYNTKFLQTLKQIQDSRPFKHVRFEQDLDQAGTVDDAHNMQDTTDFNHDKDSVKPDYKSYADSLKNLRDRKGAGEVDISKLGNFDDDDVQVSKKFAKYGDTGDVKVVTVTNARKGMRNG